MSANSTQNGEDILTRVHGIIRHLPIETQKDLIEGFGINLAKFKSNKINVKALKSLVDRLYYRMIDYTAREALKMYFGPLILIAEKDLPLVEILTDAKYHKLLTSDWISVITGKFPNMSSYEKSSHSPQVLQSCLDYLIPRSEVEPSVIRAIIHISGSDSLANYLEKIHQVEEQPAEQQQQQEQQPVEQLFNLFDNHRDWLPFFTDGLPKGHLCDPLNMKYIQCILGLFYDNELDDSHVKAVRQYFCCPLGQLTEAELPIVKTLCESKIYLTVQNMSLICRDDFKSNEDDMLKECFIFLKKYSHFQDTIVSALTAVSCHNTISSYVLATKFTPQ